MPSGGRAALMTMQAFFSADQLLHDPQQFMRLGRICKPTDLPTRAEALMARPTQGGNDRFGDGYTVPSRRDCSGEGAPHTAPEPLSNESHGWMK